MEIEYIVTCIMSVINSFGFIGNLFLNSLKIFFIMPVLPYTILGIISFILIRIKKRYH